MKYDIFYYVLVLIIIQSYLLFLMADGLKVIILVTVPANH